MEKSPDAFRTITEVAEHLETPAHVLRFWESRFPQIRPVKRAGGRRYYRPTDVALLTGIKRLLHDEGLTIRGVQKILREHGVKHVAGMGEDVFPEQADIDAEAALEAALAVNFGLLDDDPAQSEVAETATVVTLETALRRAETARTVTEPAEMQSLFDLDPELPAEPDRQVASVFSPPYVTSLSDQMRLAPDGASDLTGVANRLRALPRTAFLPRADDIRVLQDRLAALHDRLMVNH